MHARLLLKMAHEETRKTTSAFLILLLCATSGMVSAKVAHPRRATVEILSRKSRVYGVTSYGADPTGKVDSTDAIARAVADAFNQTGKGDMMQGITNHGGARVDLEGGIYLISKPLQFPVTGAGNIQISGGTLQASNDFPVGSYLIQLSPPPSSRQKPSYNYEYVTLKDLMLDCNYRGGGISVINSLRTSIDNCYITHFTNNGILSQGGHETYIRNSFIGQHITAGGDHGERNFSGTGISLIGNDNSITDVVIFSAGIGVMVTGQGNTLSGVHCYNKATGFGGVGIYLNVKGITQTRVLNCYMDYAGIVIEDPNQVTVSNTFFLGDAFVLLKSVNGFAKGVNIVDNMFSGSGKGVENVRLDQSKMGFSQISQVVVERNSVNGMNARGTSAKETIQGNATTTTWTADFNRVLLFPNLIRHVQYSFITNGSLIPKHAIRSVEGGRVTIGSDVATSARVDIAVDQSS